MSNDPAASVMTQFGVGDASPVTQAMEAISATLKKTNTHHNSPGLRGTRSRRKERTRLVRTTVSGNIVMEPTPTEIDYLIEKILGGTSAAGVTDVADTLPEFYINIDKVTKVCEYSGCRVGRAMIQAASGEPIRLTLDIEGEDETVGAAGSFPALTLPTDNIFVCSDITLTLEGASRQFNQATLTIDNFLLADLWRNSLTRPEIEPGDRQVQLTVEAPYSSNNSALYDAAIAGAAASLAFSDGSTTYTFAAANAKIPADGAEVPGRGGELVLPLTVDWYSDATTSECKCTKT